RPEWQHHPQLPGTDPVVRCQSTERLEQAGPSHTRGPVSFDLECHTATSSPSPSPLDVINGCVHKENHEDAHDIYYAKWGGVARSSIEKTQQALSCYIELSSLFEPCLINSLTRIYL